MKKIPLSAYLPILFILASAGGCQSHTQDAPDTPEAGVITVHPQTVPLSHDLVGRLAPTRTAQVRARVTGIVLKRAYEEGTDVSAGQLLFKIDPDPLQAALDEKQAALKQARAGAHNASIKADRTRKLAARGVIARQALDDAEAEARSSQAAVAQAEAAVKSARLELSYTRVTAPIDGRAGRAMVTEGALVSQSEGTQLTTIEQIDPLYVDFSQPLEVVEQWRRAQASGTVSLDKPGQMTVHISLPDGSSYGHVGKLGFTDMRVDPDTGSVSLRATVANPEHALLPGMYVQLRLNAGRLKDVMRVPQQSLQRDGNSAYVLVLDDSGTVQRRTVHTHGTRGSDWIIDRGLSDGDRVIVSGIQQVRPGGKARAVPWSPDAPSSAASTPAAAAS